MPQCSVIIPVYNKASLTRQCLDALLMRPPQSASLEIIVVDDASTDLTAQLLGAYGDRIRVVTHATNAGFATACNDGAAVAGGEYLVFLNNDTIPEDGWLDALVRYAANNPQAAAVGGKLLFPDDTVQHAGVVICQDRNPRHIYGGFPADHPAVNKSRTFQIVTAACALVRRGPFEKVGGFDNAFLNGYEDVDFCLRLRERGYEVHYCHESVVYHLESVSINNELEYQEPNFQLYRRRWAHRVQPDDFQYYFEDGLLDVAYGETYPAKLVISPLLAVVDGKDRARQADRLLDRRARRMFDLMKDNIRLRLRTQEAELQRTCSNGNAVAASTKTPVGEPRLLFQGEPRPLVNESGGCLISIIVPVKNGAAKLRELLPRFLAQRSRDQIEIVAVDSASTDDSVDTLRQAGATVVTIDPQSFNHGLTRNLATKYARGSVFVFLNQSTLPADELWLANLVAPFDKEPSLAGVCGRVLPRHDADLLTHKDINQNENAKPERSVRAITNLAEYQALSHDALRQFVNFHTLSAAIRADVFRRLPFRETNFAEDLMWGKDALEAGYKIAYEPSSVALHSHNYSFLEIFRRNFDDGLALRKIVGWRSDEGDVLPAIVAMVRDDHRYLERECRLDAHQLEQWRLVSVLRRAAQVMGHWIGVNQDPTKADLTPLLSITERIKAGAKTEAADGWRL